MATGKSGSKQMAAAVASATQASPTPSIINPSTSPSAFNSTLTGGLNFASFNSLSVYAFLGLIIVTLLAATFQYVRFKRMRAMYASNDSSENAESLDGRRQNRDMDRASIQTLPAYFGEKLPEYSETEVHSEANTMSPLSVDSTLHATTVEEPYTTNAMTDHSLEFHPPTYETPTSTSPYLNPANNNEEDLGLTLALSEREGRYTLFKPGSLELLPTDNATGSELEVIRQVRNAAAIRQQINSPQQTNFAIEDRDKGFGLDEPISSTSSSASPLLHSKPAYQNVCDLTNAMPHTSESQPDEITIDITNLNDVNSKL